MSLAAVQRRQQAPTYTGGHKGGASTGEAIGAVGGGILGGMVGAATGGGGNIPGAIMGAAGGAGVGGALGAKIGNWVDPAKEGKEVQTPDPGGPQLFHSERSEQLRQSLMAMNNAPQEVQDQYGHPLVAAYLSSIAQDNAGYRPQGVA